MTRTYGALSHVGDHWSMGGLDPHVIIKLKALFEHIPKGKGAPFQFQDTPARCADLAWFESRYPMAMSPDDRRILTAGVARNTAVAAEVERIKTDAYEPPLFADLREGQEVRDHQARAAAMLQKVEGLLVGDDVGEGKTYTTGACALLPGALPAIVVCMPHLRKQWAEKLRAFTTLSVEVIDGTKPKARQPADVTIIGYTQLAGWADVLEAEEIGLIAFDEMQELRRGAEADKGRAALRLTRRARLRLGLTATPIYNYGDEIWKVMQYLRPEVLGAEGDFLREWCTSLGNGKHRVKDPKALGTYLRDANAFTRKTKDRAGRPNVIVRPVWHDANVLAGVENIAHQLALTATSGTFTERGEAARELDMRVRQATGVSKAPAVARAVALMLEAGEPVVLFGWHRAVYDIWMEALRHYRPAMFTGSESAKAKEDALSAFASGQTDLLIMSLRSGTGIDGLQHRASTVVFGELDWSPGIHHQCIGRLDREGQRCYPDPVTAVYLVADDGADPPMMETLGVKASQAHHIVDPSLGVQAVASDDSKMRGLVDRYLKLRKAA
jgi:superfamily II DNA or RNA helicase